MMHELPLQIPPQLDIDDPSKAINQQKPSHSNQQRILEDSPDVFDSIDEGLSRSVVDIQRE